MKWMVDDEIYDFDTLCQAIKDSDTKIKEIDELIEKKQEEQSELRDKLERLRTVQLSAYSSIVLDAAIIGAKNFKIRHGMTAPYTHEYYMTNDVTKGDNHFCEPVTTDGNWWESLPKKMVSYLIEHGWTHETFMELKAESDEMWNNFPKSYSSDVYTLSNNHVANGYETNGFSNIMDGNCHGTYSTFTTTSQNVLSCILIVLKGFCLDYFYKDGIYRGKIPLTIIKDVYKRHGIDSDIQDILAWVARNPERAYRKSKKG